MNRGAWRMRAVAGRRYLPRQVFPIKRAACILASVAEKTAYALLRAAIMAYQGTVSPLLGGHCRFYPPCSHYTLAAMERHGSLKGLFLGACRLLRCNGFFHGGCDPVPGDGAVTHASRRAAQFRIFPKG